MAVRSAQLRDFVRGRTAPTQGGDRTYPAYSLKQRYAQRSVINFELNIFKKI